MTAAEAELGLRAGNSFLSMKKIVSLLGLFIIATCVYASPPARRVVVVDEISYPVYELIREVEPVRHSNPVYPIKAKRERRGGETLVGAIVGEDGNVRKAYVERALADPDIQEAARAAVAQWRFPKLKEGKKPIAYIVFVPVAMRPE